MCTTAPPQWSTSQVEYLVAFFYLFILFSQQSYTLAIPPLIQTFFPLAQSLPCSFSTPTYCSAQFPLSFFILDIKLTALAYYSLNSHSFHTKCKCSFCMLSNAILFNGLVIESNPIHFSVKFSKNLCMCLIAVCSVCTERKSAANTQFWFCKHENVAQVTSTQHFSNHSIITVYFSHTGQEELEGEMGFRECHCLGNTLELINNHPTESMTSLLSLITSLKQIVLSQFAIYSPQLRFA